MISPLEVPTKSEACITNDSSPGKGLEDQQFITRLDAVIERYPVLDKLSFQKNVDVLSKLSVVFRQVVQDARVPLLHMIQRLFNGLSGNIQFRQGWKKTPQRRCKLHYSHLYR